MILVSLDNYDRTDILTRHEQFIALPTNLMYIAVYFQLGKRGLSYCLCHLILMLQYSIDSVCQRVSGNVNYPFLTLQSVANHLLC